MPRGRPSISIVRNRLAEMLFVVGKLTAYDAHKHYIKIFAATTRRNVYYQLEKGELLKLFKKQIVEEQGEYSWGSTSRKVYYSLQSRDGIQLSEEIQEYFTQLKKKDVQGENDFSARSHEEVRQR